MKSKHLALAAAMGCALGVGQIASADVIGEEWFFNVDGTSYGNGFVTPDDLTDVPGLDSSGFDEATGLGDLIFTIATAGAHYFGAFFDHSINFADNGFANENGSISGAPAAGQSWELDEPFDGDIFFNSEDGTLDNTNAVDAVAFPVGTDVSMATAFDFTLLDDQVATIAIEIAESLTTGAFKLIQTDFGTGDTVQMAASISIKDTGQTPVPATLALMALGLFGLRRAVKQARA